MTTNPSSTSGGSFGVATVLGVFVGVLTIGYGLLLVPASVLGGAWVGTIGLSLVLSGLFATEWVRDRFGLSAADGHTLSRAFAGLAALLLVAFVAINGASFEFGEIAGSA